MSGEMTVIKKTNKIISDSDVCDEDNPEDHGEVLQQRWPSVENMQEASLKRQPLK